MHIKKIEQSACIVSIVIYALSLSLRAFSVDGTSYDDWPGWGVLVFGLLGQITGDVTVTAWWANPFLIAAWIALMNGTRKTYFICGLIASLLGASFMLHPNVLVSMDTHPYKVFYGPGYFLWLASAVTILITSVFLSIIKLESKPGTSNA